MSLPAKTLTVHVELPWSVEGGAAPDPIEIGDQLRLLWIIEQVRLHRIGVGKGAELAEMPFAAFIAWARRQRVVWTGRSLCRGIEHHHDDSLRNGCHTATRKPSFIGAQDSEQLWGHILSIAFAPRNFCYDFRVQKPLEVLHGRGRRDAELVGCA